MCTLQAPMAARYRCSSGKTQSKEDAGCSILRSRIFVELRSNLKNKFFCALKKIDGT